MFVFVDLILIIIPVIFARNCQIAFSVAESQLDIPSLLDIRDLTESRRLDRRSLLTYLAQFYHRSGLALIGPAHTLLRSHWSRASDC